MRYNDHPLETPRVDRVDGRHDIVQALAEKKQRTVYRLTLVKVGSWAILDVCMQCEPTSSMNP